MQNLHSVLGSLRRIGRSAGLSALLALVGVAARAQQSDAPAPAPAAPAPAATPIPTAPKFSGFVQYQYTYDRSDLGTQAVGTDRTRHGFFFKRVRLVGKGDLDAKTKYQVMLAMDAGTATLLDAFAERQLMGSAVVARLGQFKYPFGLEGPESGAARPTSPVSESSDGISKKLGSSGGSFRDFGAHLGGDIPAGALPFGVEYAFAVINGSGPVAAAVTRDNNNQKDVVAMLRVKPAKGVMVGVSGHHGRAEPQGGAFPLLERTLSAYADVNIPTQMWRARAEYISGLYQNARGNGSDTNPMGWYVLGGVRLPYKVEALVRYENYRANRLIASNRLETTTLGATWSATPQLRLRLNYLIRKGQPNAAAPSEGTKATGKRIGNYAVLETQWSF